MTSRVGQQFGNYRLIRLLGEGGFAEVYLGEHVYLNSHAAIKVLHSQLSSDDIEKFRTEARTIVRLIHPHIVRVLEFGIEGKTPFLVMDHAPNGTLRQQHPKGVSLSLATTVSYVKPIAYALQFAHDEKLVHRDVKPENMLVGRHNEILLSDFGIAIVAQSSRYQNTQDMAGTIAYMAPEQIQAHPRPASDQYSLGIVVYEWLTGERPFHGSFTEIAIKHSVVPPSPLREKLPTISPIVEQVVMKALAKEPKDRFPSIQAFANALEQAGQGVIPTFVNSSEGQSPHVLIYPNLPAGQSQSSKPIKTVEARKGPPMGTCIYTYREKFSYTNFATAVSWSANGEYIASGSSTGIVQVWRALTGEHVFSVHGHSSLVKSAAWSLQGQYLASGSDDKKAQIWYVNGRKVSTCQEHSDYVKAVSWSPKGSHIASASYDRKVLMWEVATGKVIFVYHGHSNEVNAASWSPNGRYIASGGYDNMVHIWESATGKLALKCSGDSFSVNALNWSPNGNRLLSGSGGGAIHIWDTSRGSTGKKVFTYHGHSGEVNSAVWSPGGRYIASGGQDHTVQIWDATTALCVFTYRGHSDIVNAVTWSPDGKYIASGSSDGTVQVWLAS